MGRSLFTEDVTVGSCRINGVEEAMDEKVQHSKKLGLKCRTIKTIVIVFNGGRN